MSMCIYHGNCADGFTAAWIIWKKHPGWIFHAGVYQDPPPDVTGHDVYLVDFSYQSGVIQDMARAAKSITIIDHHKTAIDDLSPLVDAGVIKGVFDLESSGAVMAWRYFHDSPPPQLLLHIQDRDLWKFELEGTREIQANVFSYPYDFMVWDELMRTPTETLRAGGAAIERKHFKDIHELLGVVTREFEIGGYRVKIANLPYTLTSDAGHVLAQGTPFGGCYWDTPSGRVFSLRSTDDGVDVSEIAKQYGGGGHRNASGFRVPYGHDLAR